MMSKGAAAGSESGRIACLAPRPTMRAGSGRLERETGCPSSWMEREGGTEPGHHEVPCYLVLAVAGKYLARCVVSGPRGVKRHGQGVREGESLWVFVSFRSAAGAQCAYGWQGSWEPASGRAATMGAIALAGVDVDAALR